MPGRLGGILTSFWAFAGHGFYALLGITGLGLSCVFAADALGSVRVNAAVLIELPARSEFSSEFDGGEVANRHSVFHKTLVGTPRASRCLPGAWVMPQKMAAGTEFLKTRFPRRSMPTSGEGLLRWVRPSALLRKFYRTTDCTLGSTMRLSRLPGDKIVSAGRSV